DISVFKCRRRRIFGDLVQFREIFSHRGFERRLEIRDLNAVEWWHSATGASPLRKQWIWIGRDRRCSCSGFGPARFSTEDTNHCEREKHQQAAGQMVIHMRLPLS